MESKEREGGDLTAGSDSERTMRRLLLTAFLWRGHTLQTFLLHEDGVERKRANQRHAHEEARALLYMCMNRSVELQDVCRGGGSRCEEEFGMTFTKNNFRG